MKAGIFTFHEADNYGAVLQAYALQQALKNIGMESEFVTVSAGSAGSAAPRKAAGNMPVFAKKIQAEGEKRSELFREFRETRLCCSKPYGKDRLGQLSGDYDVFITGSDQVWNFTIPGTDLRYLLPFAPKEKCFSYAASFGTPEIPEQQREMFQKYLCRFSELSVREASGRDIVRELTGRDAVICLDPTLLLTKEDWLRLIPGEERDPGSEPGHGSGLKSESCQEPRPELKTGFRQESGSAPEPEAYTLLFMVDYDEKLALDAKKYTEKTGTQLRVVTAAFQPQFGFGSWSSVGVTDWLRLICRARSVFTNSFHGCAFSLLFERPLCVGRLKSGLQKRSGRIEELLARVGLTDSREGEPRQLPPGQLGERLSDARKESVEYLKGIAARAGSA